MPCRRTRKFTRNSRVTHLLHSPSARLTLRSWISMVARRSGRFQWTVIGSRMSSRAVSSASAALSASEQRRPLRQDRPLLRLDDRVGRADQFGPRHALVHHEALQDAAHLGVAFFVPGQVGGEVVEGADRAADVGQRKPGQQFTVLDVLRRERDRHGEQARPHAVLPGRDPERRAAADRRDHRLLDRQVVEQELRRRLLDDAEVRHVGLRVPHEEVEDVVLARVGPGRERRPRRRGLRRMARLEAVEPALGRELRERRAAGPRPSTARSARGPSRRSRG